MLSFCIAIIIARFYVKNVKSHVPKDAGVLDGEAKQAVPRRYGQNDREGVVWQQERDHPGSLETVLREVRRKNLGTRVSLHGVSASSAPNSSTP